MKKYLVFNDIHYGAPHGLWKPEGWDARDYQAHIEQRGFTIENSIYLGDNEDLNHCATDKIGKHRMRIFAAERLFGENFLLGNHEINFGNYKDRLYIVRDRVLFTHGDILFWGYDRAMKYRSKNREGSNWLRRWLITATLDQLREIIQPDLSDGKFWERAARDAEMYSCHTIVCGHKHPRTRIDETRSGLRVIVNPRGVNEVEV